MILHNNHYVPVSIFNWYKFQAVRMQDCVHSASGKLVNMSFLLVEKMLSQLPGCIHKWTQPVFIHPKLVTFTSECKQVVNTTSQLGNTSSPLALEWAIRSIKVAFVLWSTRIHIHNMKLLTKLYICNIFSSSSWRACLSLLARYTSTIEQCEVVSSQVWEPTIILTLKAPGIMWIVQFSRLNCCF